MSFFCYYESACDWQWIISLSSCFLQFVVNNFSVHDHLNLTFAIYRLRLMWQGPAHVHSEGTLQVVVSVVTRVSKYVPPFLFW